MRKKIKKRFIILPLLFLLALIGLIRFFLIKKSATDRFAAYEKKSQSFETTYGKMTFIDSGDGEPVLSVHGICGGYDQAYDTLAGKYDDYRIIAPSRFGYPGTDMPENATIEMQVEAFVELLDHLKIDKTYILATSAGGTAAIKFALMHPERTKGLILYCSGYPRLEAPEKEISYAGPPSFLCNDFAMWLISPLFKPVMGMERDTLKMIMPFSDKKAGIVFDSKVTNTVMYNHYQDYDLARLTVPVLSIHSKDDKLAKFDEVEPWISRIKDCTFLPLEGGGHLMEGHSHEIEKALDEFIQR